MDYKFLQYHRKGFKMTEICKCGHEKKEHYLTSEKNRQYLDCFKCKCKKFEAQDHEECRHCNHCDICRGNCIKSWKKEFIKRIEMIMLVTPSPIEKGNFIDIRS